MRKILKAVVEGIYRRAVIAAATHAIQRHEREQKAEAEDQPPEHNPPAVIVRFISSQRRVIAQVPVPLPLEAVMMLPRVNIDGTGTQDVTHRCFVLMGPAHGAMEYHEIVNERAD